MKSLTLLLVFLCLAVNAIAQVPVETERLIRFPEMPFRETRFGENLVMTERWLACTAPNDPGGLGKGAVYIFERQGGDYALNTVLYPRAQDTTSLRDFGDGGIALMGDTLAVATSFYSLDASLPLALEGRVHLYRLTGSAWTLDTVLEVPDPSTLFNHNLFGTAVALASPDEVLVGAPGDIDPSGVPVGLSGSIYRFTREPDGEWRYRDKMFGPTSPNTVSAFARTFAVHGDRGVALGVSGAHEIFRGPSGAWPVSYTHLTLPTICSV